jgi:Protein of unknown function (DUF2795)
MDNKRAAEIQVVLEGVRLPATRKQLVDYAAGEDPDAAEHLALIPDREYARIDEVGEVLSRTQPPMETEERPPAAESGEPPGGDAYVTPFPQPGRVRLDAPPDNPPQKAIEQQSKTLKDQAARQGK